MVALLLGAPHRPPDVVVAAERAGEWEARTGSPLAAYLVGRSLVNRGWFASAAPHLDRAIAAGRFATPRIEREVLRQRAIVACGLADGAAVQRVLALVKAEGGPYSGSAGRRAAALRLLDRCSVSGAR